MSKNVARGGYPKINEFIGARIRERRLMLGMSQLARIRERRLMLGMSQLDLAESIGLATQQTIYKFEVGLDGVSASRLFEIAGALGTSVDYFFEGFEANGAAQIPPRQRMLLRLMRSLGEIDSEEHLEAISHLIRALATP